MVDKFRSSNLAAAPPLGPGARASSATNPISLQESLLADDLGFLLARANALSVVASNAGLAKHGLRVRSYSVLALVADAAHAAQRDLADFLRLDPSQIVALVDELESSGLVVRKADAHDRRSNVLRITPEGARLLAEATNSVRDAERELHRNLSAPDQRALKDLLRTLAFI